MGKTSVCDLSQIKGQMKTLETLQKEFNTLQSKGAAGIRERIEGFAQEVGAPLCPLEIYKFPVNALAGTLSNIRIVLQARMMFYACVSAKWSCCCAAGAAILSLLSAAVALASYCGMR